MEITFGICGTAGRKEDAGMLNKQYFEAMCIVASGLLDQCRENNYEITHLVSGGAAWSDHCAVKLFLDKKVPHLRLFLPCGFENGTFVDSGIFNPSKNPGGTLNHYHRQFQMCAHINSLTQIHIARAEGAELIPVSGGFYGRNAMIAKSDFLLAMTFGKEREVKNSGTAHTVECYLKRVRKEGIFDKSFHYDLNQGQVFEGCLLPKDYSSQH